MTSPSKAQEMREEARLLPCPFCGPGQSMVDPWFDDVSRRWAIGCGRCGASSGRSIHAEGSKEAAIKSWNTRPSHEAGTQECGNCLARWRCFHCGEVFADEQSAKEHFGPDTEWQAGCIDPLTKDETERRADQVAICAELDGEREENSKLHDRIIILETAAKAGTQEPVAWRVRDSADHDWILLKESPFDEWKYTEPLFAALTLRGERVQASAVSADDREKL